MAKKIIFIVEDDPDISEMMQMIVENEGYKVKTFLKNDQVQTATLEYKPALIIMDLWIGSLNSVKLVKSLKKGEATSLIPIILVSAKDSLEKIAKQSKADDFLSKPFNIADLVKIIKKFVR